MPTYSFAELQELRKSPLVDVGLVIPNLPARSECGGGGGEESRSQSRH